MFDAIKSILTDAIDQKVFPGCVLGIYHRGQNQFFALGHHTYDTESPFVHVSSIYDVASITKAIPISSLALKLLDDGIMFRDDQLIHYLPEFTGDYRDLIRIEHLLTQTLSFNFRLSDCKNMKADQILSTILNTGFAAKPGERFFYANATSILLGLVIERCVGKTLDVAANEIFFEPLNMHRTFFKPAKTFYEEIVPTEIDLWRAGIVKGEVHDESAWALHPRVVGSAGLFSTAPDLLRFISMIINEGSFNGHTFFSPVMIAQMGLNQLIAELEQQTGLGWELNQPGFMGCRGSGTTFGKTGFTGCSIVIDTPKKTGFVLLSNHIFPQRRNDRNVINNVRAALADTILGSC
jgi:CubicO group peptidase (beta-lactamase class C family)